MAMITGGELLIRTLLKAGVKTIFGLHGAHLETLFQSCLDHRIPIVDVRHEVAAGYAAEAYARTTRGLGVCMVTAGPGFTNVVSSIANAFLDRTPVLYLAGTAGLGQAETSTLQAGIDQVAIAKPITKWAHKIELTRDIPRLVAQAIRLATSGHGPGAPRSAQRRAGCADRRHERHRARDGAGGFRGRPLAIRRRADPFTARERRTPRDPDRRRRGARAV